MSGVNTHSLQGEMLEVVSSLSHTMLGVNYALHTYFVLRFNRINLLREDLLMNAV